MEKADEPYSTRVIGVYATKPGVLLTERDIETSLDDMVPVGVIGVIPTKVTAENGPIRRGDLLVSARTGGHAMVADPDRLRFGMVLGKALKNFRDPGTALGSTPQSAPPSETTACIPPVSLEQLRRDPFGSYLVDRACRGSV